MHFFCKKHPFYFAGSENLCTFVVNLVMSISNGATVVDRTYQDNNNNLNSKRNDKISVKTTANDKDCHERERTEIRSKLGTIGKNLRKGSDRVCL